MRHSHWSFEHLQFEPTSQDFNDSPFGELTVALLIARPPKIVCWCEVTYELNTGPRLLFEV
jgi:hypothetical protein